MSSADRASTPTGHCSKCLHSIILVPIPFGLWFALAYGAEMLPQPPITRNQVELMQIDSVASPGAPGFGDLRISPTSLQDVLPAIMG